MTFARCPVPVPFVLSGLDPPSALCNPQFSPPNCPLLSALLVSRSPRLSLRPSRPCPKPAESSRLRKILAVSGTTILTDCGTTAPEHFLNCFLPLLTCALIAIECSQQDATWFNRPVS